MTQYLEIYSLEGCPYSVKAEKLVKDLRLPYKVIKVTDSNKQSYKDKNQMATFPQIFIVYPQLGLRKLIGGYTELTNVLPNST